MRQRLTIAILVGLAAMAAGATEVTVGGQVRPRWEGRDSGTGDGFTGMRVRTHVRADAGAGVWAFVQWQDVRIWGEETNTLGDARADAIDLHQGYVEIDSVGGGDLHLRLGRQEIAFGGQRLVGAVGWAHAGRAFDAARLTATVAGSAVDVIAARLGDTTAPTAPADGSLVGLYARLAPLAGSEAYLLRNTFGVGTEQFTVGLRRASSAAGLDYRLEGAWQTGERGGQDVAAWFVGARVGRPVGPVALTLWYDHLSGDGDPGDDETHVFDTLFATNHKYYGFADLFLNIPAHTGGRGLSDLALKAALQPAPGWNATLDLHAFRVPADAGLRNARLGEEVDAVVRRDLRGVAGLSAGASYVRAGDGLVDLGRLGDDLVWAWAMMDVRF